MPKARSPNRDKAFEIFKENQGNISNREIARILSESEKSIAVWKKRDCWLNKTNVVQQINECCTTKEKENTTKKIGGTLRNKGGAPIRNKNALKTGEYETIFFDTLADNERELLLHDYDAYKQIFIEIDLLSVREYKMLKRIKELEDLESNLAVSSVTKTKKGYDETIVTEIIPVKKPIMELEEALTRIQARKSKYIEMLNNFGINYDKLELDKEKVKIYKNKSSLKISIDDLIDGEDLE